MGVPLLTKIHDLSIVLPVVLLRQLDSTPRLVGSPKSNGGLKGGEEQTAARAVEGGPETSFRAVARTNSETTELLVVTARAARGEKETWKTLS